MSDTPQQDADNLVFISRQLALHGITLQPEDLLQTAHHYSLLLSHAGRVMGWPLAEHIEPAPEFRPGDERSGQ